jgi:hypothetical protein
MSRLGAELGWRAIDCAGSQAAAYRDDGMGRTAVRLLAEEQQP